MQRRSQIWLWSLLLTLLWSIAETTSQQIPYDPHPQDHSWTFQSSINHGGLLQHPHIEPSKLHDAPPEEPPDTEPYDTYDDAESYGHEGLDTNSTQHNSISNKLSTESNATYYVDNNSESANRTTVSKQQYPSEEPKSHSIFLTNGEYEDDVYDDQDNQVQNGTVISQPPISSTTTTINSLNNQTDYVYDEDLVDYGHNTTLNGTERTSKQLLLENGNLPQNASVSRNDTEYVSDYYHDNDDVETAVDNVIKSNNSSQISVANNTNAIDDYHQEEEIDEPITLLEKDTETDITTYPSSNESHETISTRKQPRPNSKMQSTLQDENNVSTESAKKSEYDDTSKTSTTKPTNIAVRISKVETHTKVSMQHDDDGTTKDPGKLTTPKPIKQLEHEDDYYDDQEDVHISSTEHKSPSDAETTQINTNSSTENTQFSTVTPITKATVATSNPTSSSTIPVETTNPPEIPTSVQTATTAVKPSSTTSEITTKPTTPTTVKVITHKPVRPIIEQELEHHTTEHVTLQPVYVPSTTSTTTTTTKKPKTTISAAPRLASSIKNSKSVNDDVKTKVLYKPVNQFGFTVDAPFEIPAHLLPETTTTTLKSQNTTTTTTTSTTTPKPTTISSSTSTTAPIKTDLTEISVKPGPKIRPFKPRVGLPPSITNKHSNSPSNKPSLRLFPLKSERPPLSAPNPNDEPPPDDVDPSNDRAALGWDPVYRRRIVVEDLPRGLASTKPPWGLTYGQQSSPPPLPQWSTPPPWSGPSAVPDLPVSHRHFYRTTTTTTRKPPWLYPEEDANDLLHRSQGDNTNSVDTTAGAPLSSSTKSTLILCAVFAGAAAMFFASVMVFCMIRQKRKRLIRRRQLMNKLILETGSEASSYGSYGSRNENRPFAVRVR